MNTNSAKQLEKLCHQQQHRIWLQRIRERSTALLWWCASVLLMAGATHQLFFPVNIPVVTGIAILPPLLILIRVIIAQKPTMTEAAIATDRQLQVNSLFVSAWELVHARVAVDGIGKLLIARAEKALPAWRQHMGQPPRFLQLTTLAAISVAVLGLFFLLLPPQAAHITESEKAAFLQKKSFNPVYDAETRLNQLFLPPQPITAENQLTTDGQQVRVDPSSAPGMSTLLTKASTGVIFNRTDTTQSDQRSNPDTVKQPLTEQASFTDSTQIEGNRMFNQTAGNQPGSRSDEVIPSLAKFDQFNLIDIEIQQNNASTAFNREQQGTALNVIQPQRPAVSTPDQNSESYATFVTRLSAEQRYVVSRYFKQLEKTDESHE